jgi:Glycosyltransferase family 9 (heptosyltransferase)
MRHAKLVITIDTGVLHLAAAVNANIVALHGPTRSACWGARNPRATSLDSTHFVAGYLRYGYERHPLGHETMLAHTVEGVARAAFAKLKD